MNAINRAEIRAFMQSRGADPYELVADDVLDIILARRFGIEYQPIIEVQACEVVGYQASARFWTKDQQCLNSGKMFAYLHNNPLMLYYVDLEMKKMQIEHAPVTGWLMLNLDVDSFFEGGDSPDNPFLQMFKQHAWSERELVVNLVTNHQIADAYKSQRVIELLQQSGTGVALEDVGLRWGMFSLSAFMDARVIKFSGPELQGLNEVAAQSTVDWLVSAARRIGVQIIMDGVDSCEQFEWAKRMGVDCVQGNLFAKQDVQVR
ncbi:diguanylate phosphodiesterase [Methylovorus sp. MM2]|uniref:EAL domain-containing protein n=1 Tax=Methylovorus sp. MM2 TaxID=1848038 RepID=UPI0007DF931D|nr:EAL domain-containing protein [Methylovorus sp. MM2]OAM51624.1 diguanylate phosphodiesterase [Methylovorus sp. MM2]